MKGILFLLFSEYGISLKYRSTYNKEEEVMGGGKSQ